MTIEPTDTGASPPIDRDATHVQRREDQRSWWSSTWPLRGDEWKHLGIGLLAVVAVGVAIGELLTNWSAFAGLVDTDQQIAENLADGRTDSANDLAHWGAFIADTPVKIGISIMIAAFLLWKFRRWHEAAMVGLPLIFEATAFVITTFIVKRPRPDVERLLDSPVNSSFPSGHVAAATVYAAIVIVVFWHTRAVWARVLAVGLAVAAPLIVGWARMYQGMHFLTDVIAGIVLGIVSIVICWRILGPPPRPAETGGIEIRPTSPASSTSSTSPTSPGVGS